MAGSLHGIGLRTAHYGRLLHEDLARIGRVDFVEALSENFMWRGGRPRAVLERVRRDMPVALHGVSLSIGSVDPLSADYLDELKTLVDEMEPLWVSDHLCFSSFGGHYGHDLWPLPCTAAAVHHVASRIAHVQDVLGRQIAVENVSSYLQYESDEMTEAQFVAAVVEEADCLLLLDVNNVVVSARNHGFSATEYVDAMPAKRIVQLHLAGHTEKGDWALDDHVGPTPESVWRLFDYLVRTKGSFPTIVEWDTGVPSLETYVAECENARAREAAALP